MAYDLAGLREEVLFKLQNHDRYTASICNLAINRGIDDLVLFISEDYGVYEALPPVDAADSSLYAIEFPLPADLFKLKSVSWDGEPISQLTQKEFVNTTAEFATGQGDPQYYYIRARSGRNKFLNVWPRPSTQKTVQIYYVAKPADLALDADVPVLDRAFSAPIVLYACWWLLIGQPEEEKRAGIFEAEYLAKRAEAYSNIRASNVYRTQRAR